MPFIQASILKPSIVPTASVDKHRYLPSNRMTMLAPAPSHLRQMGATKLNMMKKSNQERLVRTSAISRKFPRGVTTMMQGNNGQDDSLIRTADANILGKLGSFDDMSTNYRNRPQAIAIPLPFPGLIGSENTLWMYKAIYEAGQINCSKFPPL